MYEEGGKFIGHRILPVSAIRPGKPCSPLRQLLYREKKQQPRVSAAVNQQPLRRFIETGDLNNLSQLCKGKHRISSGISICNDPAKPIELKQQRHLLGWHLLVSSR